MNKFTSAVTSVLLVGGLLSASIASAAVIDFEGYQHGQIIDNQYSGVTISANNIKRNFDYAVAFDSGLSSTEDSDLEAPFYSNAADRQNQVNGYNPGNILIIQENKNGCADRICNKPDDEGKRAAGSFKFEFDKAITLESIDFFDVEGAETAPNRIELFDAVGGSLALGQFFVPDTGGDNLWQQVAFNIAGVSTIIINMGGSGAIDNLTYSIPSEVPVPAAALLFAPALLGFMGLRRKVKATAV